MHINVIVIISFQRLFIQLFEQKKTVFRLLLFQDDYGV